MYQNVLFDLDDTLLDFQAGQQAGITKILQSQGVQDLSLIHISEPTRP